MQHHRLTLLLGKLKVQDFKSLKVKPESHASLLCLLDIQQQMQV